MTWKIGDKVRLTGSHWPGDTHPEVSKGKVTTIAQIDRYNHVKFDCSPYYWDIGTDWEIELVEREEETMSVDFSDVNVGDKVRLTRENGDESTFIVTEVATSKTWIGSKTNNHHWEEWDTLEIVERAFKPVPGLYTHRPSGSRFVMTQEGGRVLHIWRRSLD